MEVDPLKSFNLIASFVDDLHGVFGKGKTPLDLYHRLTEHIKAKDTKAISRIVRPFEGFVNKYRTLIVSGDLSKLPRGTIIPYENSDRVYIEIEKFIYHGDQDVKSSIHRHLLAISALLCPDDKILEEFENKMKASFSDDAPEAQMFNKVVERLENSLGESECNNPMEAISQVLSGGLVTELFSSMQQGMITGEMDPQKLIGVLQNTLGSLSQNTSRSPPPERPKITDITEESSSENSGEPCEDTNVEKPKITNITEEPSSEKPGKPCEDTNVDNVN